MNSEPEFEEGSPLSVGDVLIVQMPEFVSAFTAGLSAPTNVDELQGVELCLVAYDTVDEQLTQGTGENIFVGDKLFITSLEKIDNEDPDDPLFKVTCMRYPSPDVEGIGTMNATYITFTLNIFGPSVYVNNVTLYKNGKKLLPNRDLVKQKQSAVPGWVDEIFVRLT